MMLVSAIKDVLRPHKYMLSRPAKVSWTRSLRVLKEQGLSPRSVFDIGVAHGTWELYAQFPDAFYYLAEPVEEAMFHMGKISEHLKGRCRIDKVALSDEDGTAVFDVRADIQGSTMMDYIAGPTDSVRHDTVVTRRFDSLYPEFETPALVKIDVQGAEMKVLRGMQGIMDKIEVILVEVSTLATLKDTPEAHEVIHFLWQHGFVLADVMSVLRRPLDHQTSQVDLMFIRDDCKLRRDRRWS
jgi:FkbM family methyltransferase